MYTYSGYSYFNKRWELTNESITDNWLEIKRLRQQVIHLEQVVVYLLTRMIEGEAVTESDDAIREFLHLPPGKEEDVIRLLKSRVGDILGKVHCPECDALVEDIAGVFEEKCSWCGASVQTER